MNSARLFAVLFMLTLKTEVAAKDACSLTSDGTDMCQPASNTGTYDLSSSNAQYVRDGSCDFGQGPCGYTQGCRRGMAPQWKHSAQGYFEMHATQNGGFGNTSVLESPVLDVTKPSCLSFTAFRVQPVWLAVVLSKAQTNCTLMTNQTNPQGGNVSFDVDLPLGVARIMFQGFHGGDNMHYARIYNVSVNDGCCKDPAWSSFLNDEGNNRDHPFCSWSISDISRNPTYGAVIDTDARDGTLTTPLIRATPPGETDCLTFEYFLSNHDGSTLTVSIVDVRNILRPLWTVRNQNNTGTGTIEHLQGQIPVSSSVAFMIQFTGRRNQMVMDTIVAIRKFSYQRGQASTAPCTIEPPEAAPLAADQGNSNTGAIVGGVIIAVLIVLAIAIGGFIAWRRRQKKGTEGSGGTASPTPMEAMMHDGRERSANQYALSGRANPSAPTHHAQSEPGDYYSAIKDARSSQQPSHATHNGYSVAKNVAPRENGRIKEDEDLHNPYEVADTDIHGLPNPAFVDDYNHLGGHGQNENAGPSRGGQDDHYSHVDAQTPRPNVISNGSVSKSNGNPENSLQSNDDHQLERGDIYATPHKANKDGGPASHDDYNRLGVKEGNSAAIKGRGATPRAYDHVGITDNEADPYDVAHRPKRNQTVDSDYNRLGDV